MIMMGEVGRCATCIAAAFVAACRDELAAPKPGNVHVFADGHRMTAADFIRSAQAAAGPLTEPGARVGRRIRQAVAARFAAVGMNTNLGIVLLGAPLAAAAEAGGDLQPALARVLDGLDIADADYAFQAIVQASPGGLGRAERHDVRAPATVTLQAAMAEAAGRDRIARQYVTNYSDVFAVGEPALITTLAQGWATPFAALAVHLAFLASAPDSHVVRKHGFGRAEDLQAEATRWHGRLRGCIDPQALLPELLRWDAALKADAINPGTSADLTVATLFAHRLRSTLPSAGNSA
jgi:triphosphoribosyl-dephospho-CoA synthase